LRKKDPYVTHEEKRITYRETVQKEIK
jgi:hypothetical protein